MNAIVYILGIILQAVAGVIALIQVRYAPRRLPWLLISISSLLIVARRSAVLGQSIKSGKELSVAEIITLIISLLFFFGVILMSRMFRDVYKERTAHKQSEDALRESEKRYHAIFDSSNDALVIQDIVTNSIIDVNKTMLGIYGYTDKLEALKLTIEDLSAVEEGYNKDKIKEMNQKAIDSNSNSFEWRAKKKNGEVFWAQVSLQKMNIGGENRIMASVRDISERKQAEKALNTAYEKLESLWGIASLADADIKTISDHILASIVRISGSEFGFYGFINDDESVMTMHSWSGEAMKNCLIADKPQRTLISEAGVWGEAIRHRKPFILNNYSIEHPAKKGLPQGHVALTRLLVVPFFSHGKISSVAAVANRANDYAADDIKQITIFLENVQMITERKRLEEDLRAASLYTRNLIEASLDPMVTINSEGKITDVNKATEHVTGVSRESLIGKDFADYFTEPDKAREGYKQVFLSGIVKNYPLTIRHVSGRATDVLYNASVYKNESGEVQGVFAVARDITERKRAEAAMVEREEYLRTILRTTADGFWTLDSQGKIRDINDTYCRMLGRTREEILKMCIADFNAAEGADEMAARMKRIIEKGSELFETRHRRKDGSVYDVEVSSTYIDLDGGRFVCFGRDITERKRAEAEKEKLEAQNRQLQKSESLGRMAGAIAHHFNNQLHAVMGNLELIMNDMPPDKGIVESLDNAMQAARSASEVSSLMMTYLGQTVVNRIPMNLSEICRRILPLLIPAAPKNVVIDTNLSSDGTTIQANLNQIQQVLTNLLSNAWEAIGDDNGSIRISVKSALSESIPAAHRFPVTFQPRDTTYVWLEVADTGCGIPENDIDKLFDPFFTTKFTGRGMGLPAVLGIVRAHDGVITVESKSESGSIFSIYFPQIAVEIHAAPVKPDETIEIQADGLVVLLVEDEELVRNVAVNMLEHIGFSVITANDGVEALDLFKERSDEINCVLCDLTMPRMDGWETLTAMRQIAPCIPVILASGYSEAQVMDGRDAENLKAVFLGKPYRTNDLRKALGRALGKME